MIGIISGTPGTFYHNSGSCYPNLIILQRCGQKLSASKHRLKVVTAP